MYSKGFFYNNLAFALCLLLPYYMTLRAEGTWYTASTACSSSSQTPASSQHISQPLCENLVLGSGKGFNPQQQHFVGAETFGKIPFLRPEFRVPCNVRDPLACNTSLLEVCTFNNGAYGCTCPPNYSRLPDGRCKVANECFEPSMNNCSTNAICIDEIESYRCQCKPGFTDISPDRSRLPGRICVTVEAQCSRPREFGVDCDPHATCQDTPQGYTCVCQPGYVDTSELVNLKPGRRCSQEIDECADPNLNDCHPDAICVDTKIGYTCRCKPGYVDVSPNVDCFPGRDCALPGVSHSLDRVCHPQRLDSCPSGETCTPVGGKVYRCKCPPNTHRLDDGKCTGVDNCRRERIDCDPNASCINLANAYSCQCNPGYRDVSPDPHRKPGRKCSQLINECATPWMNDCSPLAECIDTPDSYICQCKANYVDVSSTYGLKPGRMCTNVTNMCADPSLNSCDPEATCITKPDGYICVCPDGYRDVSSNAKLPPGRVCTIDTLCPMQPTDLVFLIDGSGSIGTEIFYRYVMRFVHEFVTLFDISLENTRVGIVQYTGQVKPEFYLGQHTDIAKLQSAIQAIRYVGGLTKTGAALEFMTRNTFTEQMGARVKDPNVHRIGVVITDGRAQDEVKGPADEARRHNISLYAVGVTRHVWESELEQIAGSRDRVFIVPSFKELNTRLRAKIQKEMCKEERPVTPGETPIRCAASETDVNNPCDRSKNLVCVQGTCGCADGFCKDPITGECGTPICNKDLATSCPYPYVCKETIYGDARCACPDDHICHPTERTCVKPSYQYHCAEGEEFNYAKEKCEPRGTFCKPPCDPRKKEECLASPHDRSKLVCQCPAKHYRDPTTGICQINECAYNLHDCSPHATCTDTFDGYICACRPGYIDESPDQTNKPGRICKKPVNVCETGRHNCSPDASCFPSPTGGYTCECKEGYLDMSPNKQQAPGTVCKQKVDECADSRLNNCSENAVCTDTDTGYLCRCKPGFKDLSPLTNLPGRKCVKDLCQTPEYNDCWRGRCRTVDAERGAIECDPCPSGFQDKSPDPNYPGRVCVPKKSPCSDPTQNKCSAYASCIELEENAYSCQCRDGYDDLSPDPKREPGRVCEPATDPCRDQSMNDCDANALCEKKGREYTCTCRSGYKDTSASHGLKPGRRCTQLINECQHYQMNNCSRYAKCIDLEDGYTCECLPGYHDNDPKMPGRKCTLIINECESPNLNDCHPHAKCTDQLVGYTCACEPPYVDHSPDMSKPGRVCKFNECSDPSMNDCDPNAECQDTDNAYVCFCKEGYQDMDPSKPGRSCIEITTPAPVVTEAPCDVPCGTKLCCSNRGEVCLRGACSCPPGFGRTGHLDHCVPVDTVTIPVIVNQLGESPLVWSSTYSNASSPRFIEIADLFSQGVDQAVDTTSVKPYYVDTVVGEIKDAHHISPKLPEGLLVEAKIQVTRGSADPKEICDQLQKSIEQAGYTIGKSPLHTPEGYHICKPPKKESEPLCGEAACDTALGEVCIGGRYCSCPYGQGRHNAKDHCQDIVGIQLPLLVIRKGNEHLIYNSSYGDPSNERYKNIVDNFKDGIGKAFARTQVYPQYTGNEVRDIRDPRPMNESWDKGLWFEFTTYFLKGYEPSPTEAWNELMQSIKETGYSIGGTDLYIAENQPPFACYKHQCDKNSILIGLSNGGCACKCAAGYVDKDVAKPGSRCVLQLVTIAPIVKPPPNCGENYCHSSLLEICRNGECVCPEGKSRRLGGQPCIDVETFNIPIVVDRWASMPLQWSTVYEHENDPRYIEMHNVYLSALGEAVKASPSIDGSTVSFEVPSIQDPSKTYPTIGSGLLFNTSIAVSPGSVSPEEFCKSFVNELKAAEGKLGNSQLHVDLSVDPCAPIPKPKSELPCGNVICKSNLGEVCIGERFCACPFGFGRKKDSDPCVETLPISMPLWVIRRNQDPLYYGTNYSEADSPLRKEIVKMFEDGIRRAFARTPLDVNFIDAAVRDIKNPKSINGTWDKGLWFELIGHFTPSKDFTAAKAHSELLKSIKETQYSIGGTELYINEWQPSMACYKNDCFKGGICIPLDDGKYTCKCPPNYEDKQPNNPGRYCTMISNPCSEKSMNSCDENAECVFISDGQYRCECKAGYVEPFGFAGPKGTKCVYDLCADLPFCKEKNATCVNFGDRADCQCLDGYLDIRKSPISTRAQMGLDDVFCLKPQDLERCALGIHNCIPPAVCIGGKGEAPQCRCPDGTLIFEGVLCREKLDSCAECNYHGDCIFKDNQTLCQCHDWYTGEKCTTDVRIILVIIFAIIFFLLTLLCCLYFCLKCHFIRNRGLVYREMGGSSGSEGLSAGYGRDSDFYTDFSIPRAKLKEPPMKGYSDAAAAGADRRMMQYLEGEEGMAGRGGGYRDDMSESEYSSASYQEEIRRKVTKDVVRTVTTRRVSAGGTGTIVETNHYETAGQDKSSASQIQGRGSAYSQRAGQSEYDDEQDYSSTEYDEAASDTSSRIIGETFDTKTSMRRFHEVLPEGEGDGGIERFVTETSKTRTSKQTHQM